MVEVGFSSKQLVKVVFAGPSGGKSIVRSVIIAEVQDGVEAGDSSGGLLQLEGVAVVFGVLVHASVREGLAGLLSLLGRVVLVALLLGI